MSVNKPSEYEMKVFNELVAKVRLSMWRWMKRMSSGVSVIVTICFSSVSGSTYSVVPLDKVRYTTLGSSILLADCKVMSSGRTEGR